MQTRRIVTALLASLAVFYLWMIAWQTWGPKPVAPVTTTQMAEGPEVARPRDPATTQATRPQGPLSVGSAPALQAQAPASQTGAKPQVRGGTTTAPATLGDASKDNPYPMQVEITPRGAAVTHARIRGHYQTVEKQEPYTVFRTMVRADAQGDLREYNSLVTSRIRFVDQELDVALDQVIWERIDAGQDAAAFAVEVIAPDGTPLARVRKTYTLPPQPAATKTSDLGVSVRVENLTATPLRVVVVQQGPIGFAMAQARGEDRKVIGAMWEDDSRPEVRGHLRSEVLKGDVILGRDEPQGRRIAWVAEANQYFTCIMAPTGRQGVNDAARFDRAEAVQLTGTHDEYSDDLTFRYVSLPQEIAPGGAVAMGFDCYIGPKSKDIFEGVPSYQQRNFYGVISESFVFCAPAGLVSLMMWMLNVFHSIWPYNYGIAIFILVLVVRAILHPITKKSQVNMMKMQKQMSTLQPKIAAAREKYANDKAALSRATMEIYQEAGVNPAGSILTCLPMMLQLPIWGALWQALSSTIEMRHAPFDGWWIRDLTQPDALIPFGTEVHIPLLGYLMSGPVTAFNLLPVLLGISQLLQTKFMPRSTAPANPDNPDQIEQQRKMMMFMSVFFVFLLYNAPSGLNLYIMASNLFGILEQWRIRKHLADLDKNAALAPAMGSPPKRSWLLERRQHFQDRLQKWHQQLEKQVEGARKQESQRKGGGKGKS